jgi:shikimate dehydrogenase
MSATRLGVLGWPVAHSLSPAMHNAALRAAGLEDWRYQLLPVPPQRLGETVRALPQAGFRGANVTIPHKSDALALAQCASARARAIGAANTLLFEPDGGIVADNTDAPALSAALAGRLRAARALVLGAGGSARAAVWALLDGGAAEVSVWSRNPAGARALCGSLGGRAVESVGEIEAELLINCTPVGMAGDADELKVLPVNADQLTRFETVVDFAYRRGETALVHAARARALHVIDGLELLLGQGALAFERFTGRAASLAAMREAIGR